MALLHKHGYHAGEKVEIAPVEWVHEHKGFLTHIECHYVVTSEGPSKGQMVTFHEDVPKEDRQHLFAAIADLLAHREITYPE